MNRNTEYSFDLAPQAYINRSRFRGLSHSVKTSMNTGQLVPLFWKSILPGDTFSVDTSKVVRLQTLITPMMDNMNMDTYWFFVPNRLLWQHWEQFMGGKQESPWITVPEYTEPQVTAPSGGWDSGTIADYLGIPPSVDDLSVSALPFRAYAKIYNDWFMSENLDTPQYINEGDSTTTGTNATSGTSQAITGGFPLTANKYHDRFTSALPAPQRGENVPVPLVSGELPVHTSKYPNEYFGGKDSEIAYGRAATSAPLWFLSPAAERDLDNHIYADTFRGTQSNTEYNMTNIGGYTQLGLTEDDSHNSIFDKAKNLSQIKTSYSTDVLTPINLVADIQPSTISELRTAFQIQKFLERNARSGIRYIEIIKGMFGVTSPDARLQRAEYLGGSRFPVRVYQQTASTAATNQPLGDVAGFSITADKHHDFTKSFVEHGILMCLGCVRYEHTYQQGIERDWSRVTRYDYYWPLLQNISEQPIYNREIFAQGTSADNQVFGYQEAWSDYRYMPNRVSGEMRSNITNSLDVWHLADDYASLPYLSSSWLSEDKSNVDRVLAVTSSTANQIFCDVFFDVLATRPLPVYSIPGLIDHF